MKHYPVGLLNGLTVVAAGLTITFYSLYALGSCSLPSNTAAGCGIDGFAWTVPPVVFGVFRYLGILFNHNGGADPAEMFLHDRLLVVDVVIWTAMVLLLLLRVTPCAKA